MRLSNARATTRSLPTNHLGGKGDGIANLHQFSSFLAIWPRQWVVHEQIVNLGAFPSFSSFIKCGATSRL